MSTTTCTEIPVASEHHVIRSPLREFTRRFVRNRVAVCSSLFILLLVLMAVFSPWITPYDPMEPDWFALSAEPSAAHWFGTDEFGRDILSRIMAGTPYISLCGRGVCFHRCVLWRDPGAVVRLLWRSPGYTHHAWL